MGYNMKLIFLCVANSARSQIAEGLAREILGPKHEVFSAGSMPSGRVQPWAVLTLEEIGIDISEATSKSIDDIPQKTAEQMDFVITLCAEEVCPLGNFPKAKRLHWPIKDPAAVSELDKPIAFKEARDLIRRHLEEFRREYL